MTEEIESSTAAAVVTSATEKQSKGPEFEVLFIISLYFIYF